MPPQLANPAAWIEPTLRQAWADFMVANHLVTFPLDKATISSSQELLLPNIEP